MLPTILFFRIMFLYSQVFLLLVLLFCFNTIGCKSVAKRLDARQDLVADTGELTRHELQKVAHIFAKQISSYFNENPKAEGIFLAFLPSKNETSELMPTSVFDNTLTSELLNNNIYTVKIKNRDDALKEFEFSRSGLTQNTLSVGKLKSPNFFVECVIKEQFYRHRGEAIVEQIINLEVISIETLLVLWSNNFVYRKQAVSSSSVEW